LIKKTCDRCGAVDVPMKSCGLVTSHDYCVDCEEAYEIYMKRVNALQEELSVIWEKSLSELRAEFLCIK